jgi:hypothetical protein
MSTKAPKLGETMDPTWPSFMKALFLERQTLRILEFPHCEAIINEQLEKEWADWISCVDTTEFKEQMVANLQSTMDTLQLGGAQHAGGSSS